MSDLGVVYCPHCGRVMARVATARPMRRLWRWFNYGTRPRGQLDYECAMCGSGVAIVSYYVGGHSLRGRITNFRAQRTLEPVPRFFAIVAVAGVGVGWLASWMSGRQKVRWQVPLVALAASWLFMESSALRGRPLASDEA